MSRAGAQARHCRAVPRHLCPVFAGIYDWYLLEDEKRAAFEALAAHIVRIVDLNRAEELRRKVSPV